MAARKPRPQPSDNRSPWQIAQAARCGCGGTDHMCGCQNENAPWRYGLGGDPPPTPLQLAERRIRELEGHVRTLELQQQTDRQTIANLVSTSPKAASAAATNKSKALSVAPPSQGMETLVENANARIAKVWDLEEKGTCSLGTLQVARSDRDRALIALGRRALAALQSHKGGEGDSELAAADNNHKADCTTSGGAG